MPTRTNGMSVAALVLGIASILCCFLFVPPILAIVFGVIGLNQTRDDPTQKGREMAIAGIVLGAVGAVLLVLLLLLGQTDLTLE